MGTNHFRFPIPARVISQSRRTASFQSSKVGLSNHVANELWGVRGMHIFAIVREIFSGLIHRYRPELHYMRGPGPKWLERHGTSSVEPG